MKYLLFFLLLIISSFNLAKAETALPFPTTEADIVKALTPKPISKRERKGFGSNAKGIKAIRDDSPRHKQHKQLGK